MGFGSSDGVRQKFTGYERDSETGLDYAKARYYSSTQGRFTGVDPISGRPGDPQSWNRYTYVGNNPLVFTDPSGMNYFYGTGAIDPNPPEEDRTREHETESALAAYNQRVKDSFGKPQKPKQPQVVDVRQDKAIVKGIAAIQKAAKPLKAGETANLSEVKVLVGNNVTLNNATVIDAYGRSNSNNYGVLRPVAYVGLDQGGNIMTTGLTVSESVTVLGGDTPFTSPTLPEPASGIMIDLQMIGSSDPKTTLTQFVEVVQPGRAVFLIGPNQILKDPGAALVTVKIGEPKRTF
jgi:RHS repeat-associated protein